jgi:hypothetical protein
MQTFSGETAMRKAKLSRKVKPAIQTPLALLMVVLLAVLHPASQWTCFLMPCGAQAARQNLTACCPKAKAQQPVKFSCCKSCKKSHEAPDGTSLPEKKQTACCGDHQNQNFLTAEAQRFSSKYADGEAIVFPLIALTPAVQNAAPEFVQILARDGLKPTPFYLFYSPLCGRAPPSA